jgi:anti-sigma factor RsiW
MAIDHDATEIRRYLLGELGDEPAAALERDYFAHEELFDRVWAAEDDLVEEYLDDRLSAHQRDRFERHYLTSPGHRHRVAMARELRSRHAASVASTPASPTRQSTIDPASRGWPTAWRWTAGFAAALFVLAVGALWIVRSASRAQPPLAVSAGESPRPSQPSPNPAVLPPARTPVTIAVVLSAMTVRGADDPASVTIPQGTDFVVLHLEGDRSTPRFDRGRASLRTVSGKDIWSGPAVGGSPPSLAQVDVPADRLTPDDYIVTLLETPATGAEVERYRYFLRVR